MSFLTGTISSRYLFKRVKNRNCFMETTDANFSSYNKYTR